MRIPTARNTAVYFRRRARDRGEYSIKVNATFILYSVIVDPNMDHINQKTATLSGLSVRTNTKKI